MQQRTNILLDVYIEWMEHLYKASALFLDNFIRMRTTFEEETNLMYEFKDISSFRLFSAIFGWQIGFKLELLTGSFNQSVWFFLHLHLFFRLAIICDTIQRSNLLCFVSNINARSTHTHSKMIY